MYNVYCIKCILLKAFGSFFQLNWEITPDKLFFNAFFFQKEFKEERKILLEIIGPELQTVFDDRQIEVEFVDMHFGTGPNSIIAPSELDPYILDDHLSEVITCHRVSKSIFFIVRLFLLYFIFFCNQMNFLLDSYRNKFRNKCFTNSSGYWCIWSNHI